MENPEDKYADLLASMPTRYSRTGPPAKHGVRDLLLGIIGALLLSAALPGCVASQPDTRKVADRDSRTKHAEPWPSRIR